MQFGTYLLKRGAISCDQYVAAIEKRDEDIVPLGVIAIEEGKLAARDVLSVLRVQSDLPNDRFGDIAIELGLLSKRDVAELLMIQSDRRTPLSDCLVELGILTGEQLSDELGAFRRERERGGTRKIQRVLSHLPESAQAEMAAPVTAG